MSTKHQEPLDANAYLLTLAATLQDLDRTLRTIAAESRDREGARIPYRNEALLGVTSGVREWPGVLAWVDAYNPNGVDVFVHFWNALPDGVQPASGRKPKMTMWLPANGGFDKEYRVVFDRAIAVAVSLNYDTTGGAPASGIGITVGHEDAPS